MFDLPKGSWSVSIFFRAVISIVDSSPTIQGFLEQPSDFVPADYPDVVKIRNTFPNCAVMPLSKLTVDETGVNNGDINYFSASFYVRKGSGLGYRCAVGERGEGGDKPGIVH